jgi:hypothetical protein
MEITIASDTDQSVWDDIVVNSNEGTLFHTWKWLKIMEKHNSKKFFSGRYNGKLSPLIVWKGKEIVGLMPIFFYDTPHTKMTCSPPFSVEVGYLGPILKKKFDITAYKQQLDFHEFYKTIDDFLKNTLKSNYIKIKTSPGITDLRPFVWSNYEITPDYTYLIDLSAGEKKIWENFSHSARKRISNAKKNGITVSIGEKEDVELIYNLLSRRQRIHATKEYISEIVENFPPENTKIFIAKKDDIPLTGRIVICYKNKVSAWMGTPKCSINGISPNYLLYWESILWACNNNYNHFEIIGAADPTTYPFKVQFSGEITPFYSLKWHSSFYRVMSSLYYGLYPRYK